MKLIIAIIGLPGSGKTVAIEYLMEKLHCPKIYFGDATFDELKKRRMEINETNERQIREELRAQHGMAAFATVNLPKIETALETNDVVLIESLYSWEEYLKLKEKFGEQLNLITIYSSPKTRYARLVNRPIRPLTNEDARSRDHSQIENLHQAGPIAISDFTVINEGGVDDLHSALDAILKKFNI
ncbi:MAG: AAA family ATPase [bacterium]|nr:AAA family ATPase [bacterium]